MGLGAQQDVAEILRREAELDETVEVDGGVVGRNQRDRDFAHADERGRPERDFRARFERPGDAEALLARLQHLHIGLQGATGLLRRPAAEGEPEPRARPCRNAGRRRLRVADERRIGGAHAARQHFAERPGAVVHPVGMFQQADRTALHRRGPVQPVPDAVDKLALEQPEAVEAALFGEIVRGAPGKRLIAVRHGNDAHAGVGRVRIGEAAEHGHVEQRRLARLPRRRLALDVGERAQSRRGEDAGQHDAGLRKRHDRADAALHRSQQDACGPPARFGHIDMRAGVVAGHDVGGLDDLGPEIAMQVHGAGDGEVRPGRGADGGQHMRVRLAVGGRGECAVKVDQQPVETVEARHDLFRVARKRLFAR